MRGAGESGRQWRGEWYSNGNAQIGLRLKECEDKCEEPCEDVSGRPATDEKGWREEGGGLQVEPRKLLAQLLQKLRYPPLLGQQACGIRSLARQRNWPSIGGPLMQIGPLANEAQPAPLSGACDLD